MLGKQGRADAMEAAESKDLGGTCLGAPSLGVRGCGGPREPRREGDPRLRWCCGPCAEKAALRLHLAGPRQLRMGGGRVVNEDPDVFLSKLEPVELPAETRRLLGRFNPRLRDQPPTAPAAPAAGRPDFDPADPYGIEERKRRRAGR